MALWTVRRPMVTSGPARASCSPDHCSSSASWNVSATVGGQFPTKREEKTCTTQPTSDIVLRYGDRFDPWTALVALVHEERRAKPAPPVIAMWRLLTVGEVSCQREPFEFLLG